MRTSTVHAHVPLPLAAFSYALLIFFTVFTIAPLLWLGYTSFKSQSEIMLDMIGLPVQWTIDNYVRAWDLGGFGPLFLNSLIYCCVTTGLVILLAISAGFAFAKIPSRTTPIWYGFVVLGLLVTISSAIVPIFIVESRLGLTNTRLGIIIPYVAFNLSFAIYLAAAYVRSIADEIIEAALIDGASYLQMYWRIILPMSRPIITTIAIFTFHACWVEYVLVYMISIDESIRTVQVGVNLLRGTLSFNYGFLFAALVIATSPLLVLYVLFRKQLQAGFADGSVKG
jgi:raffinose/stachyose/melibiose transport system permease protein